jgi:hypothetical protein
MAAATDCGSEILSHHWFLWYNNFWKKFSFHHIIILISWQIYLIAVTLIAYPHANLEVGNYKGTISIH